MTIRRKKITPWVWSCRRERLVAPPERCPECFARNGNKLARTYVRKPAAK